MQHVLSSAQGRDCGVAKRGVLLAVLGWLAERWVATRCGSALNAIPLNFT